MKQYFTFLTLLIAALFFSACTKENDFLEKTTWAELTVNTTSATKVFEVWLDDELIQDSLTLQKILDKNIPTGEHRLRITQSKLNNYFVDTLVNFEWVAQKRYQFSLIELDADSNPLLFSGFPKDMPAPEDGFVTFAFLNIDETITKGKTVDILLYSMDDPNILTYEFENIPYNQISSYFKVPVEVNNNGGFLVIRDSQSKQLLSDGRDTWSLLNLPYYTQGHSKNTAIFKIKNIADPQFPYYEIAPIFEANR